MEYSHAVLESGWVGTTFEQCIAQAEARAAKITPVIAEDPRWFTANDIFEEFGYTSLVKQAVSVPFKDDSPVDVLDIGTGLILREYQAASVPITLIMSRFWMNVRLDTIKELRHTVPTHQFHLLENVIPMPPIHIH